MHKLERYGSFSINEKMGVPSSIMPMANVISDQLIKKLVETIAEENVDNDGTFNAVIYLDGDEIDGKIDPLFPIGRMAFAATIHPTPGSIFAGTGSFEGGSFRIIDGKANFGIKAVLHLDLFMFLANMRNPKLYEKMRHELHSVLSHELTHAYESYKRMTNKKKPSRLSDTKDFVYDFVSGSLRKGNQLPDDISKLLFMIYTAASYEVNARVPQMWSKIRDIKDPHDREAFIRESDIWRYSDDLEKFDADEYYEKLLDNVVGDNNEKVTSEEAAKILDTFFLKIDKQYISGNELQIKDTIDTLNLSNDDKVIQMLRNHDKEYKKVAKMGCLPFLKFWEKRFNRIGRECKHRLGKLTTYED